MKKTFLAVMIFFISAALNFEAYARSAEDKKISRFQSFRQTITNSKDDFFDGILETPNFYSRLYRERLSPSLSDTFTGLSDGTMTRTNQISSALSELGNTLSESTENLIARYPDHEEIITKLFEDADTGFLFGEYIKFVQEYFRPGLKYVNDLAAFKDSLPDNLSEEERERRIEEFMLDYEGLPSLEEWPHNKMAIHYANERGKMNPDQLRKFYDQINERIDNLSGVRKFLYLPFFTINPSQFDELLENLRFISDKCFERDILIYDILNSH